MKLEVSLSISHTLEKLHVGEGNPEYRNNLKYWDR